MITVEAYSSALEEEWDQFVDSCRTPLFFFKRGFVEYHAERFVDASLMFRDEGELVAVLPASVSDGMLSSHGGLTYGGLLLSQRVRAPVVLEVMHAFVSHARQQGVQRVLYKAVPYIFMTSPSQDDLYALVRHEARIVRRDLSSVIRLANRQKLSKGRKAMISRAKKSGLSVSQSEDYAAFHALLTEVLARHGAVPVHSIDEMLLLSQRFADNVQLRVVSDPDGRMVAATWLFRFHNTVHTQYLAASEVGRELGGLDLLLSTLIDEAAADGHEYFSFGISTEQGGQVLNEGLIAQKEGFGARGVTIDFYEMNF